MNVFWLWEGRAYTHPWLDEVIIIIIFFFNQSRSFLCYFWGNTCSLLSDGAVQVVFCPLYLVNNQVLFFSLVTQSSVQKFTVNIHVMCNA